MATAMGKVLSCPLLFHNILVQLDNKTLLLSQRVCTAFKNTITKSPHNQQKLGFRLPVSVPPNPPNLNGQYDLDKLYEMANQSLDLRNGFEIVRHDTLYKLKIEMVRCISTHGINPKAPHLSVKCYTNFLALGGSIFADLDKTDAFNRKTASWRRMHLFATPLQMGAEFVWYDGEGMYDEAGVAEGDLEDWPSMEGGLDASYFRQLRTAGKVMELAETFVYDPLGERGLLDRNAWQ